MDDKANRRLFSRYLVESQASLRINLRHNIVSGQDRKQFPRNIIDISSGGLAFGSSLADTVLFPGTCFDRIEIISPEGCLLRTSGEVKYVACSPEESPVCPGDDAIINPFYRVGIEFDTILSSGEWPNKTNTKPTDKITDPAIILDKLKHLMEEAVQITIENSDQPLHQPVAGYFSQINHSTTYHTLTFEPLNNLNTQLFEKFDRIKAVYQFHGEGYYLNSIVISHSTRKLALKIPRSLNPLKRRSTLRYVPPENDLLMLRFVHPLIGGNPLERRVVDLTPGGLSLAVLYPQDLLVRNMLIPQATLVIPGEGELAVSVQVKYIGLALDAKMRGCFKCGLSFVNLPADKADYLVSYLLRKCYPHIKDAKGERFETIWDLFTEAGFIYEEKRRFLAPVIAEIRDTFHKLLEPDIRFYKKIILKEDNKYYGTVSGIWAYEHTWIIQQLAAIRHPHRIVSRDIVLAIADFCSKHPDVGYQIIYWRPDNSWSDKVFGKYARLVVEKRDLSSLICYDYWIKMPMGDEAGVNLPPGVIIKPLAEIERPLIESYFVSHGEFVILQAYSLLRDEIALPNLRRMYQQKGLKRERQIYIALSGRRFLGFVLIEDSSMGTNLSGLVNHFKVYTTPECGKMDLEVKCGLIQKAIEYYRNQHRHFALCLSPAGADTSVYEAMGFKKKKEYMCWTFSQKLAQPYFNFVNEFFFRIERRMARKSDVSACPQAETIKGGNS